LERRRRRRHFQQHQLQPFVGPVLRHLHLARDDRLCDGHR
jgi:hypothetical protein